jgi:hypothetical protein
MSFDLKVKYKDLVLENGDFKLVRDSEKLIQDILKIALTTAGSNPSFPSYGSFVSRTLIGSVFDTQITFQMAQSQLQNSLELLKDLQKSQLRSGQRMTADEQISSIMDISINRNTKDPRLFDVRIKVISKGLRPITTAFTVSTIT